MKGLSLRSVVAVDSLPTPGAGLTGCHVRLTTDNALYWCDGTSWLRLSPAGASTEVQFNNGGSFASAANVEIQGGDLVLATNSAPAAPTAGFMKLFNKDVASRLMPSFVGPNGLDSVLQVALGRNKIAWWNPPGNSTTVPGVAGMNAPTAQGTATARNVAATNMATRSRRLGYVSTGTAGSLCGHYSTVAQVSLGVSGTPSYGGFFYQCRFIPSDGSTRTAPRMFVGLNSSVAAPTNVEPSTLTNCIGVAQLSTDATQLYLVYGGSAAQTAIALGTNFPPGTLSADFYELALFCPPGVNTWVGYRLERLNTGQVASGVITAATPGTQLPLNTTFLAHQAWRMNGTAPGAAGLDINSVYIETDD